MARFFLDITMSLDGFVARAEHDARGTARKRRRAPARMGVAARKLALESHGLEGGETGPDDELARETLGRIGAVAHGPEDVQRR